MNEEEITISVNEEDVQNIINCYEKDIEELKQLQNNWKELYKWLTDYEKTKDILVPVAIVQIKMDELRNTNND